MRNWLIQIDAKLLGYEGDIKEIYDRIVVLEAKFDAAGLSGSERKELAHKLDALMEWAQKVSEKTGVVAPRV